MLLRCLCHVDRMRPMRKMLTHKADPACQTNGHSCNSPPECLNTGIFRVITAPQANAHYDTPATAAIATGNALMRGIP